MVGAPTRPAADRSRPAVDVAEASAVPAVRPVESPASWAPPVAGLLVDRRDPVRRRPDPADPLGGTEVSAAQAGVLNRRRGGGAPLPAEIAGPMGSALGVPLDHVRVHVGHEPAALARSMQSVAFTHGSDIYFGAGRYAPGSTAGLRLLAHEVAHTVQPGGGGSGSRPTIGRANDAAEADADRIADGVLGAMRRRGAQN